MLEDDFQLSLFVATTEQKRSCGRFELRLGVTDGEKCPEVCLEIGSDAHKTIHSKRLHY